MATKKMLTQRGPARVLKKVVRAVRAKATALRAAGAKKIGKAAAAKPKSAKPTVKPLAAKPKAVKRNPKPVAVKPTAAAKKPAKAESTSKGGIADGNKAPKFELSDHEGKRLSSSALEGQPYVLYFYPKDDTPGCTIEACGFRDTLTGFTARGLRVVGVSPDSVESHARFRGKHGLNFTLLSDPEKSLAKAYGVWVKKQNYGREYMGIERSTFLVDAKGVVRKTWRSVRVPGHVDQVLEEVKHLR